MTDTHSAAIQFLQDEVARLERENAELRAHPPTIPIVGPMGPAGPMGPPGMATFDPMAGPRHTELITTIGMLTSAVHRIANALENPQVDIPNK